MCKLLKILIAVFCIILLAVIVNAHSNIYGGEDSGWDGGGSHASGTTIKYCIDTSVSSTEAQKVMSAAVAWSGTCIKLVCAFLTLFYPFINILVALHKPKSDKISPYRAEVIVIIDQHPVYFPLCILFPQFKLFCYI